MDTNLQQRISVQVLGTGCAKCEKLYAEVARAAAHDSVDVELSKIEDLAEIVSYGVAFTPSLIINGKLKCQGKIPSRKQIAAWLKEAQAF